MLEKVQASSKINIHYIRQKEPKGLGHAVWCARKFIGNEPFAVLLGDDIVQAETPCLRQLMDQYEGHSGQLSVYKQCLKTKRIVTVLSIRLNKMIAVIKCANLLKTSRRYSTI